VSSVALELSSLAVSFGSVRSLDGVTLSVPWRTTCGLIGPNGAGKTTLLNALSGFVPATGSARLSGRELLGRTPHRRARLGLGRTFQQPQLFAEQSAREHLVLVADHANGRELPLTDVAAAMHLDHLLDRRCLELSSYERVRVEIARALVGRPSLLLLDEPAAGLVAAEVAELARLVRGVRARWDVTTLVIDHNMDFVLGLCDHVFVLDFGTLLYEGSPAAVRSSDVVLDAYLGREATDGG
jgi:ABC-type branched-subunit amino acid transport system ATPase component